MPTTGPASVQCASFDDSKLEKSSRSAAILNFLLSYPVSGWWMDPLRRLTAAVRVPFFGMIVLRYDEVREVLSHDREFPVPWGWRMVQVTGGEARGGRNFVLGMADGDAYRLSYQQLAKAFPLSDVKEHRLSYQQLTEAFPVSDVKEHVVELARRAAENIIDGVKAHNREFDVVEELVTAVPAELCESYYGLIIEDKRLFARWTLVISSYVFGPPFDRPAGEPNESAQLVLAAADCLRATIRESIGVAKELVQRGKATKGVVLPRLLEMQLIDPTITDDVIHAQLFGMVLGFIPTDVLAAGNILETLLRRPEFLRRARAAAIAGDDELLWRCLRETLRFRNINPGPLRVTCSEGHVLNRGTRSEVRFKPGMTVLASTQAAMFDPRRVKHPHSFDPDRPDEDYLVFGVGQHWCLGAYIAIAQITQTLKPLLKREGLAALPGRPGRMKRFTIFPLHQRVRIGRG